MCFFVNFMRNTCMNVVKVNRKWTNRKHHAVSKKCMKFVQTQIKHNLWKRKSMLGSSDGTNLVRKCLHWLREPLTIQHFFRLGFVWKTLDARARAVTMQLARREADETATRCTLVHISFPAPHRVRIHIGSQSHRRRTAHGSCCDSYRAAPRFCMCESACMH